MFISVAFSVRTCPPFAPTATAAIAPKHNTQSIKSFKPPQNKHKQESSSQQSSDHIFVVVFLICLFLSRKKLITFYKIKYIEEILFFDFNTF
jgi:hypothetical protein